MQAGAGLSAGTRERQAPLLQLSAVHKQFGGVRASDGVDLVVPEGAIAGLIGPNGSGKTTLFNLITGSQRPDGGQIRFAGRDITGLGPAPLARLGLLRTFQQAAVYAGMTCLQCLLVSPRRSAESLASLWRPAGDADRQRALALLERVGLAGQAEQLAGELSYGQRKLLELAMALMGQPRLLLLDEPTAGVSPALIPELVDHLRHAHAERGVTLLIIEHNVPVLMDLAEQIVCLARGRVLASGTPAKVRADERVIEAYLGAAPPP